MTTHGQEAITIVEFGTLRDTYTKPDPAASWVRRGVPRPR
jgi:hypothetical protein